MSDTATLKFRKTKYHVIYKNEDGKTVDCDYIYSGKLLDGHLWEPVDKNSFVYVPLSCLIEAKEVV